MNHFSHFLIPVIGFLITSIIAVIVSISIGGSSKAKDVDPRLMSELTKTTTRNVCKYDKKSIDKDIETNRLIVLIFIQN